MSTYIPRMLISQESFDALTNEQKSKHEYVVTGPAELPMFPNVADVQTTDDSDKG